MQKVFKRYEQLNEKLSVVFYDKLVLNTYIGFSCLFAFIILSINISIFETSDFLTVFMPLFFIFFNGWLLDFIKTNKEVLTTEFVDPITLSIILSFFCSIFLCLFFMLVMSSELLYKYSNYILIPAAIIMFFVMKKNLKSKKRYNPLALSMYKTEKGALAHKIKTEIKTLADAEYFLAICENNNYTHSLIIVKNRLDKLLKENKLTNLNEYRIKNRIEKRENLMENV